MQIMYDKIGLLASCCWTLLDTVTHDDMYLDELNEQIREVKEEIESLRATLKQLEDEKAATIRLQEAEALCSKIKQAVKSEEPIEIITRDW